MNSAGQSEQTREVEIATCGTVRQLKTGLSLVAGTNVGMGCAGCVVRYSSNSMRAPSSNSLAP